jgi:hypothetical protein
MTEAEVAIDKLGGRQSGRPVAMGESDRHARLCRLRGASQAGGRLEANSSAQNGAGGPQSLRVGDYASERTGQTSEAAEAGGA